MKNPNLTGRREAAIAFFIVFDSVEGVAIGVVIFCVARHRIAHEIIESELLFLLEERQEQGRSEYSKGRNRCTENIGAPR